MPTHFDKLGLRFQYPENWVLDEAEAQEGNPAVTVYAPGGAFWSLVAHPADSDPERLIAAAERTMRREYPDLDFERLEQTLDGHTLIGAELNFIYLDLTNTCQIHCLRTPAATYVIFTQAEDREYEFIGRVFEAMTVSFLRESAAVAD